MVRTASTMLPLGTRAPDFALADPSGKVHRLADFADKPALLVMFICNHCPYVQHIRAELASLGREYSQRNVGLIAINANDVTTHPDDSPDKMAAEAAAAGYTFPYVFDASQEVAKAYHAACTPDFFLFDASQRLVYRGQLDDSRPKNGKPVTGKDLRAALDAVLAGGTPGAEQIPSMGCNIKWKAGAAPAYFSA